MAKPTVETRIKSLEEQVATLGGRVDELAARLAVVDSGEEPKNAVCCSECGQVKFYERGALPPTHCTRCDASLEPAVAA